MFETPDEQRAALLKFATALGDALFDFSISIGRAVDIIRPDLVEPTPEVSRGISPVGYVCTHRECTRYNP